MKLKSFLFSVALFLTQFSFAGPQDFPLNSDDLLKHVFKWVAAEDLAKSIAPVDRRFHKNARSVIPEKFRPWIAKLEKIERLMNQWGFTPLPEGGEIYNAGVTQELWVEVMGNNPSAFQKKKYCPDSDRDDEASYKEVLIDGKTVSMCRNFPVERVNSVNQEKRDSDIEFIEALNQIYREAGKLNKIRKDAVKIFEFRRASRAEYEYADTEDQTNPKLHAHAYLDPGHPNFLGNFTDYWEISTQKSPAGSHQPRSILWNAPNRWGFKRAGVWEWVKEENGICALVGGGWNTPSRWVVSGYRHFGWIAYQYSNVGPSRLVRTQKLP